jgi:urea transport system substrate-binding protein
MSRTARLSRMLVTASAMALALGVLGCSGGGNDGAANPPGGASAAGDQDLGKNPIVIGLVLGISGPNSPLAPSTIQATELAVSEINAGGGVLGRKIKLVLGDDGTDPQVARKAWNSVINQQHADAVIASETSAGRNAGVPVAQKANVPAIYTALYEGRACNPILYANGEVPNQQIEPQIDYLTKERRARSFFLVGSDYVWPRTTFSIAKQLIAKAGGRTVGEQYAPIGTTDWQTVVSKIQAADPDVVYFAIAGGSDNVSLMKQLRASGSEAIVASPDIDESTLKAFGPAAEGVVMSAAYFQTLPGAKNEQYIGDLSARYGDKTAPQSLFSVPNYDAIHLLALAMEKAGSTEPHAVLKGLSEVTFDGPRGEIRMTGDRHATLPIYIGEGQADGDFKIVKSAGVVAPTRQCNPAPSMGASN